MIENAIEQIEADDSAVIDVLSISPHELVKKLIELGYEAHDLETNGWQVDFWQTFTKDGCKPLMYSGSWYFYRATLSLDNTD